MPAVTQKSPLIAGFLAWVFPGLGHFYLGKKGKATFYAVCIGGMFILGVVLGKFEVVHPKRHKWSFGLQVCEGVPTLLTAVAFYRRPISPELGPVSDLGMTLTLISSAFNLLLISDAYAIAVVRSVRSARRR